MKDGSRNGASLCEGFHYLGAWKEGSFTGEPERYVKEIYQERCKKIPCKWASLSIGAPLGNLEGILFPGLFKRKNSISRFLSWIQRTLIF